MEQLMVTPGNPAAIADRDPGWTGGPDYEGLSQEELKAEARGGVGSRSRRPLRGARAALGERHIRTPRCLAGNGRRREGQRDRARDDGRQPAGRSGGLLQGAIRRGARPQLPLAHLEGSSGAGTDRHLQPLALRRGRRASRASRVARESAAHRRGRPARSGRSATRTSTPSSGTSTGTGRRSSSCSSTSPRRSRSGASSLGSIRPTRSGSSMRPTSPSGAAGTSTCPPSRPR